MKNFSLMHPGLQLKSADISRLEKDIGFSLPSAFKALYFVSNGGVPNCSWVITDDGYDPMQVADFKNVYADGAGNPDDTQFIGGCYKLMCERQIIPHTLLPFAVDDGGNFFCLDLLSGAVMFYAVDTFRSDVSMAANQVAAQKIIAISFEGFIEGLEYESGL
ncbi:SMI1/KNR4 family protein [Pseudomonas sp. ADAK2]|uniref:SMI1/KNR4 family protein n=1 Tax=unclassified Pseudomonas TaxID=196821 RepID=UPI0014638AC2|nr:MULTISPECIES: SMI1/KNR4 family protein [unclassified Pseudomonas]QJI39408.1 SMI1/KNR4 family protein [Pseudomonas sp. ADAK7]QJI45714.1 SMI1/KNR4 family protein [Pseudomonas sp. ADAK2]